MVTPAPRWTRLEHDERREQILTCARELFSEHPVSEVSMTRIAREAGVTRGLLNHYFGSKRDLAIEVVRAMLYVPDATIPEEGDDFETICSSYLDRWLTMISRNRETWFATLAGYGDDPELRALLEDSRERAAYRLTVRICKFFPDRDEQSVQVLMRGYGGMAEALTAEWLLRKRITRTQLHQLLLDTLMTMTTRNPQ